MLGGVLVLVVCAEGRDVADRVEVGDEFEMTLQKDGVGSETDTVQSLEVGIPF